MNSNFSGLGWDDVVVYNVLYKILALRVIVEPVETHNTVPYIFENAYLVLLLKQSWKVIILDSVWRGTIIKSAKEMHRYNI